ncbi:hypothetical protein EMPS_03077 [Entomortierella parvispora]|uniref:F-box domain-containing protein n=1 Tax=Entomortierella parvispora TaxID=205924 RepID=A0A9P3H6P1_9FUNG|nr:hypothetical protein EMPS_03077 [Entomortierella parvispora]
MCGPSSTHSRSTRAFVVKEPNLRRSRYAALPEAKEQPDQLTLPSAEGQLRAKKTPRLVRRSKKRTVRQEKDDLRDPKRVCRGDPPLELQHLKNLSRAPSSTTRHAAASLAGLPRELLSQLYGYVQKTVDVVHLSMTCKPLNEVLSSRIMAETYIRTKPRWCLDIGLSQQIRLRQLDLKVWSKYLAEEHVLNVKLQGPPLEEDNDEEDAEMTDPEDIQAPPPERQQAVAKANGSWRYELCAPTKLVLNTLFGKILQRLPAVDSTVDQCTRWMNSGPLVSHTDASSGKTLVCYMQKSDSAARILISNQLDCSDVAAEIPEEFWRPLEESFSFPSNPNYPPMPLSKMVQIMAMKFYPHQRNRQGKMRVLIVLAFGRGSYTPPVNAAMAATNNNGAQDAALLDIWEVIKVIEVFITVTPRTSGGALEPPTQGQTEKIVLNSHQDALRGRIIEIYNTPATTQSTSVPSSEPVMEDRIVLIGLRQYSERGNANVILMKCQLFQPTLPAIPGTPSPAQSKWICHVLATHGLAGLEATCMTLFPSRSPLERLVAILDKSGRGEIWDWIHVRRVAMLSLADVQATVSETVSSTPATATAPRPPQALLMPRKCIDGTPYTPLQVLSQTHHHLQQRKNRRQGLHYWGIHASYAMELNSHGQNEAPDLNWGDIRLVAMADGMERQNEASWWHVDEERMLKHLDAIQVLTVENARENPTTTTATRPGTLRRLPPLEIRSSGRHFEYQTLSRTITFLPDETAGQGKETKAKKPSYKTILGKTVEPLQTNAFLVWEHYRILLSAENGLCIVDMDQEPTGDILPPLKMTSAKEKELQASLPSASNAASSEMTCTTGTTENQRRVGGPHILEEDTLPTVWVTVLENSEEDPITDISTVDACLLVTRKYSHLMWPFRDLVSKLPTPPSSSSTTLSQNNKLV